MAKFKATVDTADAQDRLLVYLRVMDTELSRAITELGVDATLIFQAYAPAGATGRLGRGIRAISAQGRGEGGRFSSGRTVGIVASARNPIDGFDYVGVSRFGHRKAVITPRADRGQASVRATKKDRRVVGDPARPPALRIPHRSGGKPLYRGQVAGVQRSRDWAAGAIAEVRREADSRAQKLGRRLEMMS